MLHGGTEESPHSTDSYEYNTEKTNTILGTIKFLIYGFYGEQQICTLNCTKP